MAVSMRVIQIVEKIMIQPADLCGSIDGKTVEFYGYMLDGFDLFDQFALFQSLNLNKIYSVLSGIVLGSLEF